MPCHETVTCPRCYRDFECRVGTILRCQCQEVPLTEDELDFIRQQYHGCLCADCLREMKIVFSESPH
ncbi:cysteine-rich CWC family protein [Chitinophaga polysaccharea]|uniref:cysteine-rich CWC family protein n=1 Tax=Chitinophaga TaxID=79328 RepID=UPI001455CB35|nr:MULTISPECIES: cysteine-rich CWC family protein [Chitinophaga]NLR61316.1 cysteine-rich CWC family protein [Chitinophaga polysaccharea]NLU95152.1 cysteine-rich CWC family protein [Chitinophaga sp. Ak27]